MTRLIFHGDSFVTGGLALQGSPELTVGVITARMLGMEYHQVALGGSSLNHPDPDHNLSATGLTQVDPLFRGKGDIVVLWTGWNDLQVNRPEKTITQFGQYRISRSVIGWRLVIVSVPVSDYNGQVADYSERRLVVNNWLACSSKRLGYVYADLTKDPIIGDKADTTDKRYFYDQLHLMAPGYKRAAEIIAGAIR